MKTGRWIRFSLVLSLAAALLLAGSALAQNRGGGQGGPGSALCTGSGPGGGVCAVNPAPNSGNQNCPGYGAGKGQRGKGMMKGRQGDAQSGQSTPQANPPASTNQ